MQMVQHPASVHMGPAMVQSTVHSSPNGSCIASERVVTLIACGIYFFLGLCLAVHVPDLPALAVADLTDELWEKLGNAAYLQDTVQLLP